MNFSKCCKTYPDLGVFILRLVLGFSFFMHGSQKLFGFFGGGGINSVIGFLTQLDMPAPILFAYLLACGEFFGGVCLFLGLFTRFFAFVVGFIMAVAIWKVHWSAGFFGPAGFEFPLSLLAGAATLFFTGCTKWGLDCTSVVKNICKK